ncbi:redoxin domain-containing protein [Candidatus Fermentibacteria bacterium]|nr:redoxin domain-containing protein [Candidatus Fermentibacteria bacterium]
MMNRRGKRQILSRWLFGVAVVVAAGGLAVIYRLQDGSPPSTERYQSVGDFPEGHVWFNTAEPISLYDQLTGHVVVVHFCEFTHLSDVQDLTKLRDLRDEFEEMPISVIVVYRTDQTDLDSLQRTVDSWEVGFPIVVDHEGTISDNFGVSSFPAVLALGTHKRVSAKYYTGWQRVDLQGVVNDLIQEAVASRSIARYRFEPERGRYVPPGMREGEGRE